MPQVPYTGIPSVSPSNAPTPFSNVRANAAAFGVERIQAAGRLGGAFEKVGDELFARAYAMQELDRQNAAEHAIASATEKVDARLVNYKTQLGLAAKNGYEPFVSDLNKTIEDGKAGLTDEYSQGIYDRQMRYIRTHVLSSAGSHAATEFKSYNIGTEQAGADNDRRLVMMDLENDQVFDDYLNQVRGRATVLAGYTGKGDAWRQDWENDQIATTAKQRAMAVGRTNPQRGKEMLQSMVDRGLIDGQSAGAAAEFIDGKRDQIIPRVEVPETLNGKGYRWGTGQAKMDSIKHAIGAVESSNTYKPLHPLVTEGKYKGQRAIGRYGVMPGNLKSWLAEAGMPSMSATEFEDNPEAQDKLFESKWAQIRKGVNSDNEAAVVWFSGEVGLKKYRENPEAFAGVNDGHSSGPRYLKDFNKYLAERASPEERKSVARTQAEELAPGDAQFADIFHDKLETDHGISLRQARELEQTNLHTVSAVLSTPDENGRWPTDLDKIADPEFHAAWDQLRPEQKTKFNALISKHIKDPYPATDETQAIVDKWQGIMNSPFATDEEKQAALNQNMMELHVPKQQIQELVTSQRRLAKDKNRNPRFTHAMSVLRDSGLLASAGLSKREDEDKYNQFTGVLWRVLNQRQQDGTYPKDDEEIRKIGAGLVREAVTQEHWYGWSSIGPAFQKDISLAEPKEISQLRQILRDANPGVEPSDYEVQAAYAAREFNRFYAGQRSAK